MLQSRKIAGGPVGRSGTYKSVDRRIPDIKMMIQQAIQSVLPAGTTSSADADLVTRVCVMAAIPTGEEDPKELLRSMSDGLIVSFATNLDRLQSNPVSAPVAQLFFMEWCWRQGHLNEDWKWEWDTTDEGHVSYSSKESLDELLRRVKTTC